MSEQLRDPAAIRELLAPYALGAVDDEERTAVEGLLAHDPTARAEVHGYQRATAIFEFDDGPGPEVWDRIQAAMTDDEPAAELSVAGPHSRRLRPRALRVAVATAAAATVLAASIWGVGQLQRRSLPEQPASKLARIAHAAAAAPGARRITVSSTDGATTVQIVVLPDGRGYVLGGALPHVAARKIVYVLFATTAGTPVLLSVLGTTVRVSAFQVPPGTLRFAVGQTGGPGQVVVTLGSVSVSAPCPGSCAPATSGSSTGATPTAPPSPAPPSPAAPSVNVPSPTVPPVPLTLPPLRLPIPLP
jgi:anti-sigma-K factor RskA